MPEVDYRRMADLLRSGATMLSEVCPECGNVLFRVREEMICPRCNKPVVLVKATEDASKVLGERALGDVEHTLINKILEAETMIRNETDIDRSIKLGNLLTNWITALERIRRFRQLGGA